jgi:hypothetical protein
MKSWVIEALAVLENREFVVSAHFHASEFQP